MKEKKSTKVGRKLGYSVAAFFGCYAAMILLIFLMTVVNDPANWYGYLAQHSSESLSLLVSVFFLFALVYFYYLFEDFETLLKIKNIFLIFTLLFASTVICYIFGRFIHYYSRPVAMFAILAIFLLNRRQAIFLNFIFGLLLFVIDLCTNTLTASGITASGLTTQLFSSFLITFLSGTFAVFFAGSAKTRGSLLLTGVYTAVPTVILVLLFNLPEVTKDWIDYVSAVGFRILACILSGVLALALLPLFERAFNRLTVFRLRELTSTDAALLVRLKKEAPGTFNHSLIVAQLAESCAVAIGENAELARAAAYYHDVGKLKEPEGFTENQTDYNLHDEITPELSADIIRSHTKNGYDLLIANHLPKEIARVALEHHGTLPIKYFYDKAVRYSGDADLRDFSYFGPLPQTRIAAIIMISDAVEAAVRAMADRSPEQVEKICRSVIEERMDLGQFDECDITMKELSVVRLTLVEALSGVHHHRVQYPNIQFNRDRKAVNPDEEKPNG